MKGLGLLGVAMLVGASALAALRPAPALPADAGSLDEPVSGEPEDETLVVTGLVTMDEARVAHVFSPVAGRVVKIHVRPGQRVNEGAPLATIEAPDFDPTSDVYKAQADFVAAKHDFERQKQLCLMGECQSVEAAADELRAAKANLAIAIAKNELRPLQLLKIAAECPPYPCTYTIPSPLAGEVLRADAVAGSFVQGQYGGGEAPELFVIGDLASVSVLADVDEGDLARVHVGTSVVLRADALPGDLFAGKIDWIGGQVDPDLHRTRVRCTLPNPGGGLRPDMVGTVEIAAGPGVR
jgi:membrane fusion protein, heavy metal efflux system